MKAEIPNKFLGKQGMQNKVKSWMYWIFLIIIFPFYIFFTINFH